MPQQFIHDAETSLLAFSFFQKLLVIWFRLGTLEHFSGAQIKRSPTGFTIDIVMHLLA
ncbi:hypothetical protein CY34DRAFT_803779 [Suillus luteus UH-Slu-Lm8-n1]|uniref:Uncharacterized protein n=1 Tax=Suillus luteus UH-Slu-Lm8-n1 TaxID=930992 RepID=A0A0D0A0X3_9AGAM|nr:hypothetical protein CY34DRAFT_803779 [Suillus luteus UH-Slu-Lm8-n1]